MTDTLHNLQASTNQLITLLICCAVLLGNTLSLSAAPVQLQPVTPTAQRQSAQVLVQDWVFQALQAQRVVLQFNAPVFGNQRTEHGDVELTLQILELNGPIQCLPVVPSNRSDLTTGDATASVAAIIHGSGAGKLRLTIRLRNDQDLLPAGDYSTSLQSLVLQQ